MTGRGVGRALLLVGAAASGLASASFFLMFHAFYWKHRHEFNDQGRYFDPPDSVVHTDSSAVLILPAVGFLLLAVVLLAVLRRMRPSRRGAV